MENNQPEQSPDDFLSSALLGNNEAPVSNSTENTPSDEGQEDRGTPENSTQKTVLPEAKAKGEKNADATNLEASHKPVEQKPRSEQRKQDLSEQIRSLNEMRKKAQADLAETQKQLAESKKVPNQAVQTESLIDPPSKPKYDRETLEAHIEKYESALERDDLTRADEVKCKEMLRALNAELRSVDRYEKDMILWEARNGRAIEARETQIAHCRQRIAQDYPEVTDPSTPQGQTFARFLKQVPEVLKRADGELIAAQVTDWYMRASREAATAKELKEVKEKLQALEKKVQPAKQSNATKIGSDNSDDPDAMLTAGIAERHRGF